MKDFFGMILGLSKTVVIAAAVIIGLLVLMFGVIFGMCIS